MLNAVSSLIQASPAAPAKPSGKADAKQAAKADAKAASALGEDKFTQYTRIAGLGAGGGFTGYRLGNQAANHFQELATALKAGQGNMQTLMPSLQKIAGASMQGAGLTALVAAGVSAVSNGVGVARGKLDGQTAIKNVVSDGISGAVGGFGAVTAAGAGTMLLRSFGMAGLPLTIGTVAFGALGGIFAGQLGQKLQAPAAAPLKTS